MTGSIIGGLYIGLRFYPQYVSLLLFALPLIAAVVYMTLHGTLAGMYWAQRLSNAITRERDHGLFELLATAPNGRFSVIWTISTACWYNDETFSGAGAQRVWFSRVTVLLLLALAGVIVATHPRGGGTANSVGSILSLIISLTIWFYLDDVQSAVIGSMSGMITPLFARTRLDAQIGAIAGFLGMQLVTYLILWVIGNLMISDWLVPHIVTVGEVSVLQPPLLLLIGFALRETITRLLWRYLYGLMDGDVADVRRLSRGGVLMI